jgi:hypothetical protein
MANASVGYKIMDDRGDLERLTYRELGARLGISSDAARMKARRKAKEGAWRIVPGNHPNDRALVELPASELTERVGGVHAKPVHPERVRGTKPTERVNDITERLFDELTASRARNDALTDKLIEAKDVLHTAYEKLVSTNRELVSARLELVAAQEEHGRVAAELAVAETREMGTKAELERAESDIVKLRAHLATLRDRLNRQRMTWWQRIRA